MTLFITGNQSKREEVERLLAGLPIATRKLTLGPTPGSDLRATAEQRVLEAYGKVLEPCFVESTELALDGMEPMTGAAFKKRLREDGEAALCRELGGRRGRVSVVVAYTADGNPDSVALFDGSCEGTFVREPRGSGGYGWDRAWLPDGYRRTLAEMADNKAFVNMRDRPYLELADRLRGRAYGGSFEAHVTVRGGDVDRFVDLCDALGIKAVLIELPSGETPSQPMTASYHHGTLREAIDEVHDIARRLAAEDYDVSRVKLEAVGKNADIPETDSDAAAAPDNYFEYHIKVVLPPNYDDAALRVACERHGARLSRNARKLRADGHSEKFVTLRSYRVGRLTAEQQFARLLADVEALGLVMGQKIREYTVYDSDQGVDRGWIEQA